MAKARGLEYDEVEQGDLAHNKDGGYDGYMGFGEYQIALSNGLFRELCNPGFYIDDVLAGALNLTEPE